MRALSILFILLAAFVGSSRAQAVTSQSHQFVVHGGRGNEAIDAIPPGSILVQPDLLAMTAERVKKALAAEVPAMGRVGATIHLNVLFSAPIDMPISIVSTKFADGWTYQVAMPPIVDEARLVKALAHVLMVEYGNRVPGHPVELPAWVIEGMAQQLYFSVGPKLVVDQHSSGWEVHIRDFQHRTREAMRTNATPTFQELTMSSPPPTGAPGELLYQSSAHLLVNTLLQSQNGRQRFAVFLQKLPIAWNWQTAFREAFGFERMLDVEKWWALTTLEYTTRDPRQAWTLERSLRKLDELLSTTVQARTSPESLPEMRTVDLKMLLREENWALQREALMEKVSQLGYTVPHLSPQVAGLAVAYKNAIASYVDKRDHGGVNPSLRTTPEARTQSLISELTQRVDALESKRRALAQPTLTSR